jgi:hypothetical protein
MTLQSILLPLFVQIALVFGLLIWLAWERVSRIQRREIKWQDVALRQNEAHWPDRVQRVANCFENQLETPVLFYILVVLAIITRKADFLFVTMEWVFVATRIVHAYVFTTSNYVPLRGQCFMGATMLLLLMWANFGFRIFISAQAGAL